MPDPLTNTPASTSTTTTVVSAPHPETGVVTTTTSTTTKPWWRTSEAWFAIGAVLISALYGAGVLMPGDPSPIGKAVAVAAIALTSHGYSVSRGTAKGS